MSGSHWHEERESYYIQTGSAFQNPYGVPHRELGRQILEMPPEFCAQVIFGKLVGGDGKVFTAEHTRALFDREMDRVNSNQWIDPTILERAAAWKTLMRDRGEVINSRFCAGVDLARKKDATVVFVLDLEPTWRGEAARIVYYRRLERILWDVVYAEIGRVQHLFGFGETGCETLIDSTGAGDVVKEAVDGRAYCPVHHRANEAHQRCVDEQGAVMPGCQPSRYVTIQVDGFNFSSSTKYHLITNLTQALSSGYDAKDRSKPYGLLRCPPIPRLEEQLALYQWKDDKLETDEVMALALVAWVGLRDLAGDFAAGNPYAA